MRIGLLSLLISSALYLVLVFPLAEHLKNRPVQVKLGTLLDAEALKLVSGDQRYAIADLAIFKVLFYYGTLLEKAPDRQLFYSEPDYQGMFKVLRTALVLDPYNMDAYYFIQAAFAWESAYTVETNAWLEYGMKYRTWDFYLPFFAAFNYSYFLHDYKTAAHYMQRAAQLSGSAKFARLSSRYFYEGGQTEFAIQYLKAMIKQSTDPNERKLFQMRHDAMVAFSILQDAVDRFRADVGQLPEKLGDLVEDGYLGQLPVDPYGGDFYLDNGGKVRSTSKLVFQQESGLQ